MKAARILSLSKASTVGRDFAPFDAKAQHVNIAAFTGLSVKNAWLLK